MLVLTGPAGLPAAFAEHIVRPVAHARPEADAAEHQKCCWSAEHTSVFPGLAGEPHVLPCDDWHNEA